MSDIVQGIQPLGFPWPSIDPFLFCVHHDDNYPAGNAQMGPDKRLLGGRRIGMDFEIRDGWRMYHGDVVPGFPRHPHRGFETITLARRGYIDHADSLGATARFGKGDVQWMTAGRGIVHAEMFPLVQQDAGNPTELFQIWLNLPARSKMVDPHFTMMWHETIPQQIFTDAAGRETEVVMIAGAIGAATPPAPPPDSWAADPRSDIAVWTLRMQPGATWTLPPARPGTHRMLYSFIGESLSIGGTKMETGHAIRVKADAPLKLGNGGGPGELLMLQGRPIGEPVAHRGPFVMNTPAELRQAMLDYQRTGFGGWPWPADGPVHARPKGRFAIHADGRHDAPA